ncbi:exonuclease SbcCD subunit D [Pseudonocardia sp. H11422]|uniref:metallophosphoesterase family protein n=1 Tax=Pseudonocardia sp. H11422 TaxID=2835866 RepID=UPI001BDD62EA|nr:exonuclease subunit SbcD [Pseudonocardia sp. H11422]
MRFLHTADWHVGKTLKGRDRLAEQELVLREIVRIAREHEVDAVLVAGDLYDSAAPTAAAQRLVVRTLLGLAQSGIRVVAIAGNHDHAATLDAYRPLAAASDITLLGTPRNPTQGGVVEFRTRAGEPVTVALLPFVSQRFAVRATEIVLNSPGQNTSAYDGELRRILAALTSGFRTDAVNLVMAHLTVLNGALGGGERMAQSIFEYAVPAAIFPVDAHYTALGHLHRRQRIEAASPVHYSGAPLAVDFGEQENTPVVCLVEAAPGTPAQVTDVPITAGRRLRTLHGTLDELGAVDVGEDFLRVYVREQARAGLREDVLELLPNALEVRIDPEFAAPVTPARPAGSGARERHPSELFHEYLTASGVADERVEALFALLHDETTGSSA